MITELGMSPTSAAADPLTETGKADVSGYFKLEPLDWDTRFFGFPMGSIVVAKGGQAGAPARLAETLTAELESLLGAARNAGYAHLIYRVPADDMPLIWAAEGAGLRLVDVGIDSTFRFGTTALPDAAGALTIRPVRSTDEVQLQDLAADAFVVSRFAADPFFSSTSVSAFYRQWVTNLCNGLAEAVLVSEVEGQPAGFVSCAMSGDEGRIPLIATRAGDRRRGIGRSLVSAALQWFTAAGARVAHVKTQSANYPALALYHRAGFNVSRAELTFSIVLAGQTSSTQNAEAR